MTPRPTPSTSPMRPPGRHWLHRMVRRLKCLIWMHEWEIIDPSPGWWTRGCKHCDEYQAYELVDFGRSKTWVRYHRPPNAELSGARTKMNEAADAVARPLE